MTAKFSVFPRRDSPGFVIHHASVQMKAGLHRAFQAKGFDITPEQWAVLSSLWEREGLHQSLLAQKTAKDRHNLTRILNLLETHGLVTRKPDREDRRYQRVYLTEKGKALKSKLAPIANEFLTQALAGLTGKDLDLMKRVLGRICSNLGKNLTSARVSQ